jgi:hypothetical protein
MADPLDRKLAGVVESITNPKPKKRKKQTKAEKEHEHKLKVKERRIKRLLRD